MFMTRPKVKSTLQTGRGPNAIMRDMCIHIAEELTLKSIFILLLLFCVPSLSLAAASLTQHGITWTFDTDYVTGQFVNGDYWVLDPGSGVKITEITPGHTIIPVTGRIKNGSMINPAPNKQGYDSYQGYLAYNSETNVGTNISASTPLVLTANTSLVSSISNETPLSPSVYVSYLKTAAVLTCLPSAPPPGSFRPGYSDPDKTIYNINNANRSLLKNLSIPQGQDITLSTLTTYANYLQRPWIMHQSGWASRFLHPNDNIPDNYFFPSTLATAALLLHLNFTESEKNQLLINYIQVGIDLFGIIKAGQKGWSAEAGFGHGRKWPILFAGIILNDSGMKSIGTKSGDYLYATGHGPGNPPTDYLSFSEDAQTFHVSQFDIDLTNGTTWNPDTRSGTSFPYTTALNGMPEWGIRYASAPDQSDAAWYTSYRTIGSGAPAWAGTALAAIIMDARGLWNHKAFFDYMDRYMAITKGDPDPFGYSVPGEKAGDRPRGLIGAMWDEYRDDYPLHPYHRLFRNVRIGEVEP